jgi:hypothetical protein
VAEAEPTNINKAADITLVAAPNRINLDFFMIVLWGRISFTAGLNGFGLAAY